MLHGDPAVCNGLQAKPNGKNQLSRYTCILHIFWLILLAITAHWIDDEWNLCHTLLEFVEFESPHTGDNMAQLVMQTLEFYGLVQKLFCITTDNATNNDTMVEELSEALWQKEIHWDPATNHIRCLAHIINLVVQALLKSLNVDDKNPFKSTLDKLREIAKATRLGSKKPASFRRACEETDLKPLRIPLDVAVRWNSTHQMLQKVIYLRPALEAFCRLHSDTLKDHTLTDNEWAIAEAVYLLLTPFQRCTTRFENNSRTTEVDYVFFAYDSMFDHLEDVKSFLTKSTATWAPRLQTAIDAGIDKLRFYHDKTTSLSHIYADAMILNPRVKLSYFNGLDDDWGDKDAATYLSETRDRYQSDYISTLGLVSQTPSESDLSESQSERQSQKRSADSAFVEDDDEYEAHLKKRARDGSGFESEFDVYMSNPNGNPSIPNSLSYWRDNATKFPTLRRMAKDILAVPPSGCAVEREFSVSGRIATWQRNRLSAQRISDAMIYKAALKREGKLKKDLSFTEMEQMDDNESSEWMLNDGNEILPEWSRQWWITKLSSSRRK
jgi:hAT family C-terminal dimerisation region